MNAQNSVGTEQVEPPPPSSAAPTVATAPATVADCKADYLGGADLRAKFDATARRQYRAA